MSIDPYSRLVFSTRSFEALSGRSLGVSAWASGQRGAAPEVGPLKRPMNRVTPTALTLIIVTMAGFAQASENKTIVSGGAILISGYIGPDTKKIFSDAPASAKNIDIISA